MIKVILTAVCVLMMTNNVNAVAICDDEFSNLFNNKAYTKIEEKIAYWEALNEQCGKTGLYEARLGQLYFDAKQYTKAKKINQYGITLDTQFQKELLYGLADSEAALGNFEDAEEISEQVIEGYEDWAGGYLVYGKINFWQKNLLKSVAAFEMAVKLDEVASTYSMLAVNYHYLKEHEKVITAMQRALKLDENELKDRVAIPATASSLLKLGYIDEAEDLLLQHQRVRPESQDDPVFIKVALYLQKMLEQQEKQ